jgi:hypothetical protein
VRTVGRIKHGDTEELRRLRLTAGSHLWVRGHQLRLTIAAAGCTRSRLSLVELWTIHPDSAPASDNSRTREFPIMTAITCFPENLHPQKRRCSPRSKALRARWLLLRRTLAEIEIATSRDVPIGSAADACARSRLHAVQGLRRRFGYGAGGITRDTWIGAASAARALFIPRHEERQAQEVVWLLAGIRRPSLPKS